MNWNGFKYNLNLIWYILVTNSFGFGGGSIYNIKRRW